MAHNRSTIGEGIRREGRPSVSLGFLAQDRIEPAHLVRERAARRMWWTAFGCGFLTALVLVTLVVIA